MEKHSIGNISLFLFAALLLFVSACGKSGDDPRKKYNYNVLMREVKSDGFVYKARLLYAGTTVGLASCGIIGRRAAKERLQHELKDGEWEVVCCWSTAKYDCEEEHRVGDYSMDYDEWLKNLESHIKPQRRNL